MYGTSLKIGLKRIGINKTIQTCWKEQVSFKRSQRSTFYRKLGIDRPMNRACNQTSADGAGDVKPNM